jgi:uncharacterized protein YgiM (DUF1202 family)
MKTFMPRILLALFLFISCTDDSSQKPSLVAESNDSTRTSIPRETGVRTPAKERKKTPSLFIYTKTNCNIRGGPGIQYDIIRTAAKGEKLEYVARDGNWYRLKRGKGKPQAWVHKSVVTLLKEPTP